ncbi:hypothetical protein ACQP0U_15260 [Micromonospora sp. CA-269861]|uniref:hypothetical protein n=1 Tax=Micromonospora sp. CA-269861 TaxID=3239968 RepID=UPI003D918050
MSELRDGGVPEQCFICGHLALGLTGQDFYLAPYMLGQDRSFADDRYGYCHLRCLQESGLAGKWAAGVSDHFCERWPDFVELDDGDRRIHASFPARSLTVWSVEGWFATIPFSILRNSGVESAAIEPSPGHRLFAVASVVGFVNGPYEAIFGDLRGGPQREIDLLHLLEEIGTLEHILEPRLLEGGRIERVPSDNTALDDEYRAKHFLEVADNVVEASALLINRATGWKRRRR